MNTDKEPTRRFDEMVRARFGVEIDAYARGSEEMESHAIRSCYPAIAALELDESYASLVMTARMGRASPGIAVGTAVTSRPPHRSVREGLPHTAPPLGRTIANNISLPVVIAVPCN